MCDEKTPTLILIKSEHGNIFGGFTDQTWESCDISKFKDGGLNWIFLLKGKENQKSQKLKQKPGVKNKNQINQLKTNYTKYWKIGHGIRCFLCDLIAFGGFDIRICNNSYNSSSCEASLGQSYELPEGITFGSDEARKFLAGSKGFKTAEIELFNKWMNQKN